MGKRGKKADFSRDHDMCCLFRSGETLEEVSTHYSICRERVRQILARNGLSGADGGKAVKVAKAKKEQAAKLEAYRAKRAEKFGVTWDEYVLIKKHIGSSSVNRFNIMRHHVIKGTGNYKATTFEISLADYVDIWESSGHDVNQKGFCLTRNDYTKGFTKDNLCIVSAHDKGHRLGVENGFVAHPENASHGSCKK
jgi:hypothetical protein